jgi:excisionase family DNA binding protein
MVYITLCSKTMRLQINDFFTVAEVSKMLRLSILTIYKYIREEKIEALEFGGHYRITKTSLKQFIRSHKVRKK